MTLAPLAEYLDTWAGADALRRSVAATVREIAAASVEIASLVADGPLAGDLAAGVTENVQGEVQKVLDARSDALIEEACRRAPVAAFASEEQEDAVLLNPAAPLLVAADPLDGSSNIDTNVSIGTIFSILAAPAGLSTGAIGANDAFLQPGHRQLAAGYAIYGPQTALALTLGAGTLVFTLDRASGTFKLTVPAAHIQEETREFAINASNVRHWEGPIRDYVEDLKSGRDGVRGRDFNMRWVASLVAECHRILMRGGVFLYPGDRRQGYGQGRLRLLYEANPIGLLVEQAGGATSTGDRSVLDLEPRQLHQRVPFIFGSRAEVARIEAHHADADPAI